MKPITHLLSHIYIRNLLHIQLLVSFALILTSSESAASGGYLTGASVPNPDTRTLNTSYKVGTTSGAMSVPINGSATYNIPIFTSPGTAGMQPSLAISYNSNGSNGLLGKGWALSATSAIYRAPSANYYDGLADPVDFDSNDAFYLDGGRLIKDGAVYKTEQETYSTITPTYTSGAITKFVVKTKSGQTIEYGIGNAKLQNSANSKYFAWYISKVSDAFGNYMEYVYSNDATNGIRLTEIKYTGNSNAGLTPYNHIYFDYISRNDPRSEYVYGQEVKHTLLLDEIQVVAEGNQARKYTFNYIEDNDVSLLAEVIETGSDATRFNSTIFSYHDYMGNGQQVNIGLADNFSKKVYGDINGDGRTDLIMKSGNYIKYYTSNTNGQSVTYRGQLYIGYSDYEVGDFNGDGLEDIVVFSTTAINYYRSTGTAFTYVSTSNVSLSGIEEVYAYDVGGDNICDIIIERSSSLYVYKGDASDPFNSSFNTTFTWGAGTIFADFTGDGKNEICIKNGSDATIYQFSNTGLSLYSVNQTSLLYTNEINSLLMSQEATLSPGKSDSLFSIDPNILSALAIVRNNDVLSGDFNGDGKMDYLTYTSGFKLIADAHISDGESFISKDIITGLDQSTKNTIVTFDGDGDGKYEVYAYEVEAIPIDPFYLPCDKYVLEGQNFVYKGTVTTNIANYKMDFNGDGMHDGMVIYNNNIYYTFTHTGNTKNLLYKIADGLNNKTIIEYDNITNSTIYSANSSSSSYPYANSNGPRYVVSQVKQSNGLGGYFTQNYTYQGGLSFKALNQFMGFIQTESTSLETQLTNKLVNTYHSTYPFISKINGYLLNSSASNVSRTESTYSVTHIANKRVKVNPASAKTWDDLNSTNTNTTYWVDTNGNTTRKETVFSGGTGTVNNYYENYTTVAGSPVPNAPQTIRVIKVKNGQSAYERRTSVSYNTSNGFINTKVLDPNKAKPLTITYTPTTNGLGLVWKETASGSDFTSRVNTNQWDTKGRFISKNWTPEGQLTEFTIDAKTGNITQTDHPSGYSDVSTYDGFGRLTYNKASDQTISRNWYSGSLTNCLYYEQISGASHPVRYNYYDRLGRNLQNKTTAFETGKAILVSTSYNTKGQTASVSNPYFSGSTAYNSVYTYDDYGRLTEENFSNNTRKITYSYPAKQMVTTNSSASPAQTETKYFDDMGDLLKVKDTNNNELTYTYHSNGQVRAVGTLDGSVTTQYDEYGRPQQVSDPDAGTISYTYFVTGEVKTQNKNGNTTTYTYNKNGQVKTIAQSEGTSTYNYNSTSGLLSSIDGINNNDASFGYDGIGRMNSRTETVDGTNYAFAYTYEDTYSNRLATMTYPGNFAINYSYLNGYLKNINKVSGGALIWELQETTPYNQAEKFKYGNNLVTTHTYDYKTAMPSRIQTGSIQDWQYSFNAATGNLNWRKDNKHALQENFGYDNLNRLTSITVGSNTVNIGIDNSGNITGKDDLGTYAYNATQPHAVSAITPTNGYSPENQTATYTSFDKVSTVTQGPKNLALTYGYDHQRRKTVYTNGSTTKTKIFVPGGYEKITEGSTTKEFYYISTPAGITSVYEKVNGSGAMYYIHTDHLGSVNFITNSSGSTVQELGYDAWGRQRNAANWGYSSLPAPKFERGYTFHEQLDGFDLVNMNGRMYDPMLGRMLSPDPVVQAPGNLQNYNRYSYVLNNPLKYTDPTGYIANSRIEDPWASRTADAYFHEVNRRYGDGSGSSYYNNTLFNPDEFTTSSTTVISSLLDALYDDGINFTTVTWQSKNYLAIWFGNQELNIGLYSNGALTSTNGTVYLGDGVATSQGGGYGWDNAASNTFSVVSAAGSGSKVILDNRGAYMPRGQIYKVNKPVTVRTPVVNINTTSKVLNTTRVAGKVCVVAGVVTTGISVYNDIDNGNYYSAGTRAAVYGVAAGAVFIPVAGWGISIGIGVADAIWGDQFYNWVETKMGD